VVVLPKVTDQHRKPQRGGNIVPDLMSKYDCDLYLLDIN
jgi:hypothetical protein